MTCMCRNRGEKKFTKLYVPYLRIVDMRKGRFSKEEIAIIEQECESTPPKKIAESLNRDVGSVKKIIKEKLGKGLTRQEEIVHKAGYDLKSRPYWGDMKEQFSQEELEMFVYHWSRIIAQFRDDVFPTEEIQVIDSIRRELRMDRSLNEPRHSAESIDAFEQLIMTERQKGVQVIIHLRFLIWRASLLFYGRQ